MQRTRPFIDLLKDGPDPIAFFCRVLADESAPVEERRDAAKQLKAYYHPLLSQMGRFPSTLGPKNFPLLWSRAQGFWLHNSIEVYLACSM